MSGIVGGAGSKSGVIGTTELDYEEGVWVPTHANSGTEHAQNDGSYVKIGRSVICQGWVFADGGSAGIVFWGLPFIPSTNDTGTGGGCTNYQNHDTAGNQYGIRVTGSEATFTVLDANNQIDLAQDKQFNFTLHYVTAP